MKPRRFTLPEGGGSWVAFFIGELSMKTWHCVLFSVVVHGLIFTIPVMSRTHPDMRPEAIEWLITTSPPVETPMVQTVEPTAAPPALSLPEPKAEPVPPPVRPRVEPPTVRKKPVARSKTRVAAPECPPTFNDASLHPTGTTSAPPASVRDDRSDDRPASDRDDTVAEGRHNHRATSVEHAAVSNTDRSENPVAVSVGAQGGPQFVQRIAPSYPRSAQRLGLEGAVLLRLSIDASGKLTGVEIVNGAGNGFDEEAIQAVKRSSFAPAVQNGRPVKCLALLNVRFHLSND